jgi:GT2 family glycosyltransferase
VAASAPVAALAGYAPAGGRSEALVRRVVEGAAWHLGVPPVLHASAAALREGPDGAAPGVLLLLEADDALRQALAAGWVVVTTRRHLDARHGRELYWVASERPAVLLRAVLQVARTPASLPEVARAARALGRSLTPAQFARRFAPPLVSVVMPVYQDEDVVVAAMRSVLDQSLADLELVVVDDGSTDASRTRIAELDDPRLVLRWQGGAGPSHARNAGLRLCRSASYLAFLDSDDAWEPVFVERMIEALAVAPPQVGLAYCDCSFSLDGGPPTRRVVEDASFPTLVVHDGLVPTGSFVFRREVLDRVGPLDEGLARGEDYAWLLRVAASYELLRVPEVLFHYRRRSDGQLSTTALDHAALQRSRLAALEQWSSRVLPQGARV